MKKPYTILLPVDYSTESEISIRYALHLGKELPAEIFFFHAYTIPYPDPTNPLEFAVDLSKIYNLELEKLKRYTLETLDKYGYNEADFRIKLEVAEGQIAETIKSLTAIEKIDLIIASTHARHEIREYIWGTHTMEILKVVETPLLAIPENTIYKPWKKVLYATNLKTIEQTILEYIVKLSEKSNAFLEILHIETDDEDKWETMAEYDEFKEETLKKLNYKNINIEIQYDKNDVAQSLLEYAKSHQIDLIALNPSRPNLTELVFGRHITKELLYQSPIPILCVKR